MIEGLKVRVASKELEAHCRQQANYHAAKAAEKEALVPQLAGMLDRLMKGEPLPDNRGLDWLNETTGGALVGGGFNYKLNSKDVLEKFESDIREHRRASRSFAFFANHLFDEDYVLVEADLVRLEMLSPTRRTP